MSKHTPGPWVMINRKVVTSSGVGVASPLVGAKGYSESAANLRLIAAAPDLLEALRGAEMALRLGGFGVDCEMAALLAREAIAKATGERGEEI